MLISDLAMRELQWQRDSLSTGFVLMLARLARPITTLGRRGSLAGSTSGHSFPIRQTAHESFAEIVGDASPQSRSSDHVCTPTVMVMTTAHHARLAAVRGLFNARSGDYEAARLAFAEAARDRAQDLTALPGFWALPRAGQTAALLAYEDVGRPSDATDLAVKLRASLASLSPHLAGDKISQLERRRAVSGD